MRPEFDDTVDLDTHAKSATNDVTYKNFNC